MLSNPIRGIKNKSKTKMTSNLEFVPHTNPAERGSNPCKEGSDPLIGHCKEGSLEFQEYFLTQHQYHPGPIMVYLFAESREQHNNTKANNNGEKSI